MSHETFLNGRVQLCCGDSIHFLRDQPDNRYDSIVTDPPYALVNNSGSRSPNPGQYTPIGKLKEPRGGFMGKQWDTGETAFAVGFWAECLRVLKPGGHVVAFSGTRTVHRLVCAIEDAGFEIRDSLQWLYGSGFPKSHDVSKGIDRAAGAEREVVGVAGKSSAKRSCMAGDFAGGEYFASAPATDAARQWQGWGTALKPACEPICLARKPLSEGTVAANVLRWGTGAINVDGCRVASDDGFEKAWDKPVTTNISSSSSAYGIGKGTIHTVDLSANRPVGGRWPANVIHDGSDDVVAGFPETGLSTGGGMKDLRKGALFQGDTNPNITDACGFGDSGSAARFFYQVAKDDRCDLCDANIVPSRSPTKNTLTENSALDDVAGSHRHVSADSDHLLSGRANSAVSHSKPCHPPKASTVAKDVLTQRLQKIARNVSNAANLCGSCATAIAQEIVAVSHNEPLGQSVSRCSIEDFKKTILLRCLASYVESRENTDTILTTTNLRELFGCVFHAIAESTRSARAGSEASTEPAPKRLWYSSKADADDRLGSKHPTVKPVDLMRWLVRLVTPKGGIVLDPFAGTGTTAEAAYREGMRCVLVERESEYQADIRRRMALVMAGPDERSRESIKAKKLPEDHGPLFAMAVAEAAE